MARLFWATHPDAQVSGELLQAFINGSGLFSNTLKETLASHGLKHVRIGEWYSQQLFLNALRTIQKLIGPVLLRQVGISMGNTLTLPAEIEEPGRILESAGVIYRYYHRNTYGDTIVFAPSAENRGVITYETPYPADLEEGLTSGLLQRVLPGRTFSLRRDEEPTKRLRGSKTTVLLVEWNDAVPPKVTPPAK